MLCMILAIVTFLPSAAVGVSSSLSSSAIQYAITVQTDQPLYVGTETIVISGTISPTPTSTSDLTIEVSNPADVLVANVSVLLGETGTYSYALVPSSLDCGWIAGTYGISVMLAGSGRAETTFNYMPFAPGATSSGVPSTISTTCTTTTAPEFGNQALLVVLLMSAATVALLANLRMAGKGKTRTIQLFGAK